jgi:RNA polymerase sigma-70 factor (sigma-E family)
VRQADEASFCDYVGDRRQSLLRTAFLYTGDWHLAEDIVQTTLAKLYVAWPKVSRKDEVDAYVRRALLNGYLDERRRPWRREHAADAIPEPVSTVAPTDSRDPRTRDGLLVALAALPPRQRATLVLRFWEDRSVEQVAELMRCSNGNVKSQTARGLERLRDILGAESLAAMKEEQ